MEDQAFRLLIRNATILHTLEMPSLFDEDQPGFRNAVKAVVDEAVVSRIDSGYVTFYATKSGGNMAVSFGSFNPDHGGVYSMHIPIFLQDIVSRDIPLSSAASSGRTHEMKTFYEFAVALGNDANKVDTELEGGIRQRPNQSREFPATLKIFV